MNLCEFKGLTNSAIQAGKLMTFEFSKHWLSQISLFKVDICPIIHTKYLSIRHPSHTPRVQTRSPYPTAACVTATALCQGCQVWLYYYISQLYLLRD